MANDYTTRDLLTAMVEQGATDLLLSVGRPPRIRVNKDLTALDMDNLVPDKTRELCYQVMNESQQAVLEKEWEIDFSIGVPGLSRFRVNVFMQRSTVSAAFRRIPYMLMSFDDLGLPQVVKDLSDRPNGITLVTGPTGSGKSTTLAAMIDRINDSRAAHIITIEDPVEYLHQHKKCTVDQREIGTDTHSYSSALKSILRQDPDVVLLGEMRDMESIQAALTIAETGHVCFATLHTNSCAQTIARVVDVFPGDKQQQVRSQLSLCLNGVLTQTLMPRLGGGLVLACEVMVGTPAVRALIREGKLHHLDNQIQLGTKYGMQTMNQSLAAAVRNGRVSEATAMGVSLDMDDLRKCLVD
jgi:twitching motility protein PilT